MGPDKLYVYQSAGGLKNKEAKMTKKVIWWSSSRSDWRQGRGRDGISYLFNDLRFKTP